MDTIVEISAVSDSSDKAETAIDKAFSDIEKIDKLVDFFSDRSEITEINRNAGQKPVTISNETLEILERAIYASEKTGGAFDVTIGTEISLWDFHNKTKPEDKVIKQRLNLVNYKNLIINKNASSAYLKKKGMLIDPGGIAKGYAADKAVEVMKKNGVKSGLVSIAGDIKAFGFKPDGRPWKIGIKNPRGNDESDEIMATIELTDMAISTSGDYERYFIIDGKRHHHILNPKTGYPAEGCRSVSIVAKEGAITDPFSTGLFIIGAEKGIKLLEEMGIDGIIVDKDGKIHTTPNLRGKLEFIRDSQRRKRDN
jgi:thiamine biosynthesis lipoprotein